MPIIRRLAYTGPVYAPNSRGNSSGGNLKAAERKAVARYDFTGTYRIDHDGRTLVRDDGLTLHIQRRDPAKVTRYRPELYLLAESPGEAARYVSSLYVTKEQQREFEDRGSAKRYRIDDADEGFVSIRLIGRPRRKRADV